MQNKSINKEICSPDAAPLDLIKLKLLEALFVLAVAMVTGVKRRLRVQATDSMFSSWKTTTAMSEP